MMLSYNKRNKGIDFYKYLSRTQHHSIIWLQHITKEGEICGIGSLTQRPTPQSKRGNWSKTLQDRIKAMHEKGKDWKEF